MSFIVRKVVNTTWKRIEPCNGHTTEDVCRLLNGGFALLHKLCPPGLPFLHDCRHDQVIVLRDEKHQPDPNQVIARVMGHAGSTTGCRWVPTTEDSLSLTVAFLDDICGREGS